MNETATTADPKTRQPKVLTQAEVDAFERKGYHFPERAMSADEALAYRRRLEQSEALAGGPLRGSRRSKPHLLFPWANELIRHPAILDAVEELLGPNPSGLAGSCSVPKRGSELSRLSNVREATELVGKPGVPRKLTLSYR